MSSETGERGSRRKFQLFVPGTPKTYKQAAAEKLVKVSNISEAPAEAEDDPCVKKEKLVEEKEKFKVTVPPDPRFQQTNQTLRCFVMYTDFFRCEKILGEGNEACTWFQDVYKVICPNGWISHWDELRSKDIFPWSRAYYKAAEEAANREKNK